MLGHRLTRIVTYARQSLVSLQDTPCYHCAGRCVRRAWLWGFDLYAGRDYSRLRSDVCLRFALARRTFPRKRQLSNSRRPSTIEFPLVQHFRQLIRTYAYEAAREPWHGD